ncbi:relaxase domain-containing protein [Xanthomonas hortorum]
MQALVHGDRRIVEAHERAVAAAVREAEHLAMARSTNNKKPASNIRENWW